MTDVREQLEIARMLARFGVPLFLADPAVENGVWNPTGGSGKTGYRLPSQWERTTADPSVVDRWRSGMALCAVMGHGLDLIDYDPRNGGNPELMEPPEVPISYAIATTPSGGVHHLVASLGVRSRDKVTAGVDVKAGVNGVGHGFAFLAPTVRASKVDGEIQSYEWLSPPKEVSLKEAADDTSGRQFAELVNAGRNDKAESNGSVGTVDASPWWTAGKPCHAVRTAVNVARLEMTQHRHEAARDAQLQVLRLGEQGHAGVAEGLIELGEKYLELPGKTPEAQRRNDWRRTIDGAVGRIAATPTPEVDRNGCNGKNGCGVRRETTGLAVLPEEFWASRKVLADIRQRAHARGRSGDVAVFAILARLSAMLPHTVRIDTGVASPASLNLYVAVVSPSGAGKSTGAALAKRQLPSSPWGTKVRELPLGSGEGVAENYVGTKHVSTGDTYKTGDRKGQPKTREVRAQVHHNVFLTADEGQEMVSLLLDRKGSTLGPTLRSGWSGETLGQSNADQTKFRVIEEGTYALGMLVGFQLSTAAPLFRDVEAGTPQRFIWCAAIDPNIPEDVDAPDGRLVVPPIPPRGITMDPEIRAEIRRDDHARSTGRATLPPLDSQKPLTLCKLAGLLTVLEGRSQVNREDWELARMMWETSCAVRDAVVAYNREAVADDLEKRAQRAITLETRKTVAKDGAAAKVTRIAAQIARKIHEDGSKTHGAVNRDVLASRDRELLDTAAEYAVEQGWLTDDGESLHVGGIVPPS